MKLAEIILFILQGVHHLIALEVPLMVNNAVEKYKEFSLKEMHAKIEVHSVAYID